MNEYLQMAIHIIKTASWLDALDILIVCALLYYVMKLVRGTSAASVIKGIVVLVGVMLLSEWIGLNVINFVLRNTMQVGMVALLIMFQPELRKILETMGKANITQILKREEAETDIQTAINEIVEAAGAMSWSRTGALIVFERDDRLQEIVTAATVLDAAVSSELIKNIFFAKAPLHDGAVIIRNVRIAAAGCVLPLSENEELSKELGTRHRAGIGITEESDAVSLIVSEETGIMSVAVKGGIKRNMSPESLTAFLLKELTPNEPEKEVKNRVMSFWKGRGK